MNRFAMNWKESIVSILCGLIGFSAFGTSQTTSLRLKDIPKIDVHTHYNYDRAYFLPLLEAWNMQAVTVAVVRTPKGKSEAWQAKLKLHAQYPRRILLCTSFNAYRVNEPDFAKYAIAQLKKDIAQGAVMVKVWKNIGMEINDEEGNYVQIDDPAFQPIWDFLAKEGIPVLAHIGEPRAAWQPLDPDSPHYLYYKNHPEYHAYHHPEVPRWTDIMAARDRWIAQNPELTIIGAHLGSMAYDVAEIAERLEKYPNFYVDTAARFGDLAQQPSDEVRRFFILYQDRILYGTDMGIRVSEGSISATAAASERASKEKMLSLHWEYFTGQDSLYFDGPMISSPVDTHSLDLPPEVIKKLYYENAARILDI